MESLPRFVLFVVAVLILPTSYFIVCILMQKRAIPRPPRVPFFFLFGTLGGWMLAFMLSATCVVMMVTAAPLAIFISSTYLAAREERTTFHQVAMWSGFSYCGILAAAVIASDIVQFAAQR